MERLSTNNCARNWNWSLRCIKLLWDFETRTADLISARWPDLGSVKKKKKKKRTCRIAYFAVPAEYWVKLEESWKRIKYLNANVLEKNWWSIKVKIIWIIIVALWTIPKRLINGLENLETKGQVKTFQTKEILRSVRIQRRVYETWRDLLSLKILWETTSQRLCEKLWRMQGNWKKLWNMQVTIIPIVIGAFGTVTKGLLKGLQDLEVCGRVETVQTTAWLRTARILRRVFETWGDLVSLKLQWKPIN